MKNFLIPAFLFLASCQNMEGNFKASNAHEAKTEDGTPVRDQSITAANAYSDLFLDSASVEQYIKSHSLDATQAQDVRNFYNRRNYQFAWFSSDGFTEQGRGLWNLYEVSDSTDQGGGKTEKSFRTRVDSLITIDTLQVAASDSAIVQTELQFTQQFIRLAKNNELPVTVPAKKASVMDAAGLVLKEDQKSASESYNRLREHLGKYYDIANKGGWPAITVPAAAVKKGGSAPVVTQLKKRLIVTGELQGSDTSAAYTPELDSALKTFRQQHGLKPDGQVNDTLISILNVPVEKRIAQILVNMNRMQWAPRQADNYIEVNIPAFMLHFFEGGKKAFDMPVVVGKEGTNTMMFTGDLNQIVFSPYWNVPASIVKEEIMPAMKENPGYLKRKNMEIVEQGEVPVIRQLPGGENSLGKVKFLFPNSFDIYFHDTPAKGLFAKEKRAFSHGCIRLADAQKMAAYLLRDDPEWSEDKIVKAMNAGKEQHVKLKKPVPVRINYYTAWADESGRMQFREDVYGHDDNTARKMFL
jgi:L,D-transpeptidase YcbB